MDIWMALKYLGFDTLQDYKLWYDPIGVLHHPFGIYRGLNFNVSDNYGHADLLPALRHAYQWSTPSSFGHIFSKCYVNISKN